MMKNLLRNALVASAVMLGACSPMAPVLHRDAQRLVDKGILLMEQGKLEEAESAFWLARETADTPEAQDGLGCVWFMQGKLVDAEKLFISVIDTHPEYVDARANLALLLEVTGREREAVALYKGVLRSDPLHARARNNLGALLISSPHEIDRRAGHTFLTDTTVLRSRSLAEFNLKQLKEHDHDKAKSPTKS